MPSRLICDTCGFLADVAVVRDDDPGEVLAVTCWRDRIELPRTPPPGTQRIERRYGRWYRSRISVDELVGSELDLDCEACGAPASVVTEQRTDDARWQTATCRRCRPVLTSGHHRGAVQRDLARRDPRPGAVWAKASPRSA